MEAETLFAAKTEHDVATAELRLAKEAYDAATRNHSSVTLRAHTDATKEIGLITYITDPPYSQIRPGEEPYFTDEQGNYYPLPTDYEDRLETIRTVLRAETERIGEDDAMLALELVRRFCLQLAWKLYNGLLKDESLQVDIGIPVELKVLIRSISPKLGVSGYIVPDNTEKIIQIYLDAVRPYIDTGLMPNIEIAPQKRDVHEYTLIATIVSDKDEEA